MRPPGQQMDITKVGNLFNFHFMVARKLDRLCKGKCVQVPAGKGRPACRRRQVHVKGICLACIFGVFCGFPPSLKTAPDGQA